MSQDQSFVSRNLYMIIVLIGACIISGIWYVVIGHDAFLGLESANKQLIADVQSSDCSHLKLWWPDANNKWFKDSVDNAVIQKEKELKC